MTFSQLLPVFDVKTPQSKITVSPAVDPETEVESTHVSYTEVVPSALAERPGNMSIQWRNACRRIAGLSKSKILIIISYKG